MTMKKFNAHWRSKTQWDIDMVWMQIACKLRIVEHFTDVRVLVVVVAAEVVAVKMATVLTMLILTIAITLVLIPYS